MALGDVKISVQNLFKIYGHNPRAVQDKVYDGIDKSALMQETGHVLALNNINVDMREGQITVVMGLSGSGKSTLIRHLNRLIEPTSGQIFLDGTDVLAMDEEALRQLVVDVVHQELQGVLGQRITRNLRRMMRREIQRAFVARDLD